MFKSSELIIKELKDRGIKHEFTPYQATQNDVETAEEYINIDIMGDYSNLISLDIYVLEGGGLRIRCFSMCKISDEKELDMLRQINAINGEYLFIKFLITEEKEVMASADFEFSICEDDYGAKSVNYIGDIYEIINESHLKFMKVLWN